tara:strand:- start:52 stop:336 length:285 start_codon:yes stop_codon:yes gene_type:complete
MAPFLHWCFAALELEALAVPNPEVEILTNGTAFHDSRMLQTGLFSFSIYTRDGVESRSLQTNLRGHSGRRERCVKGYDILKNILAERAWPRELM